MDDVLDSVLAKGFIFVVGIELIDLRRFLNESGFVTTICLAFSTRDRK